MLWVNVASMLQGHVDDLIIFLATVSLSAWALVALTVFVRFVAHLRYRRRSPLQEPEEA